MKRVLAMNKAIQAIHVICGGEEGQTLIEYVLVLLIAVLALTAAYLLGMADVLTNLSSGWEAVVLALLG